MKARKPLISLLAIAALSAAATAYAGPKVTVTFKNQGTADATYKLVSSNETATYSNASPKPKATVTAGSSDTYTVQSQQAPDVNFAAVRYDIGGKECQFYTAYVSKTWSKSATPSGNATCTATITSTNISANEWAVEFDMK